MADFWVGGYPNLRRSKEMWRIWMPMQHVLLEICAASLADRQHPRSRCLVPTTVLVGHQLLLITPAFMALLLAEQQFKMCPYPCPRKSQAFNIALLLGRLGCFCSVKTSHGFRQRMGCLTTLNARSWQGSEVEEAAGI